MSSRSSTYCVHHSAPEVEGSKSLGGTIEEERVTLLVSCLSYEKAPTANLPKARGMVLKNCLRQCFQCTFRFIVRACEEGLPLTQAAGTVLSLSSRHCRLAVAEERRHQLFSSFEVQESLIRSALKVQTALKCHALVIVENNRHCGRRKR